MIHIATAANENYALGMLLSVATALHSLNPEARITLHLLNGGISDRSLKKLRHLCDTIHPHCSLDVITLDESQFKGANLGPGNSYMAYARLAMESMIKADKVIYIDADMVILKNLEEVWDLNMQGKALIGSANCYPPCRLGDDCPVSISEIEKNLPYINSGFLVVDLAYWRRNSLGEKMLIFATSHKCIWQDQTVLNYFFRNDLLVLDQKWNWQSNGVINNYEIIDSNLHYVCQRKPWNYYDYSPKDKIWRFYHRELIGTGIWTAYMRHDLFAFISDIKKALICRSAFLKNIYIAYLSSKKNPNLNIIGFYKSVNVDILNHEARIFKNYVASCKMRKASSISKTK